MQCTHKVKRTVVFVSIMAIVIISLSISPITTQFAATQLQSETALLSIADARFDNDILVLILNVKSKVGHRFPSGLSFREGNSPNGSRSSGS